METILKLGSDLYEIIIVDLQFFLMLILGPNIDYSISDAKVVSASLVEVLPEGEDLEYERTFEASADVHDGIFRK